MDDELICIGCGAKLQSTDPEEAGFLPAQRLKKAIENQDEDNDTYCQRCFRLRHYNEIMPVNADNDDFLALLNSLAEKKALIVNVVICLILLIHYYLLLNVLSVIMTSF